VLGVCVAILAVAGIAVVRSVTGNSAASAPPAAQRQPGPVLLVPGYGGSVAALQTLARKLNAAGKRAEVVALPGDGTGDLGAQAAALATAAQAAAARDHADSVDVIGYSAGGVVARLWAHDYGGNQLARRIITLGSPQHGTELASLGSALSIACPTACQQLAASSTLLAGLNAQPETANGPQYVSIWTTNDEVVIPPDSARLDGALNIPVQNVCAASTVQHGTLPTDPVIEAMVLSELAAGNPVPLTPADCPRLSS
jgi:triacylglycerol lipase